VIAAVVAAIAISVSVIPGSGADKDSAVKPCRPVIPVRRAGIRIVTVVAVRADRSGVSIAPVNRATDPNADRNLGV
jgi:hypothetical protein